MQCGDFFVFHVLYEETAIFKGKLLGESYQDKIKTEQTAKLRRKLGELPPFLAEYFRSLNDQTSARTRLGYAYDLSIFFDFMALKNKDDAEGDSASFTLEELSKVTSENIEEFMDYLTYYQTPETSWHNDARGKSRKLAAVRTMFRYFYKSNKIPANPAELVSFPKLREKAITALEADEIARLIDEVESGEHMPGRAKHYHKLTGTRDTALVTLLLGTGMRVSECVGIDLGHLDFELNGVKITRKGGDESILYFNDEVEGALKKYLVERSAAKPLAGHENALFLSMQNRRITDRAIQNLVKKYAKTVTPLKKISPHKLRSSFGTQLYKETGDIYLVANVLGHSDVNTTRKHYAKMDDAARRRAASAVRLREG